MQAWCSARVFGVGFWLLALSLPVGCGGSDGGGTHVVRGSSAGRAGGGAEGGTAGGAARAGGRGGVLEGGADGANPAGGGDAAGGAVAGRAGATGAPGGRGAVAAGRGGAGGILPAGAAGVDQSGASGAAGAAAQAGAGGDGGAGQTDTAGADSGGAGGTPGGLGGASAAGGAAAAPGDGGRAGSDPSTAGSSGMAGSAGQPAGGGQSGACPAGTMDCNAMATDGCETDVNHDPDNCGTGAHSCASGTFYQALCIAGDCSGEPTRVRTDTNDVENPLRHIGIALDENEVPHVVAEWGDEAAAINHRVRAWARTDLGNWQMLLNEEASGTDDFWPAVARDATGRVCLAANGLSTSGSNFAWACPLGGDFGEVLGAAVESTSLTIDELANPLVAYGLDSALRSNHPTEQVIDSEWSGAGSTAIARTETGETHIAYLGAGADYAPAHAWWNGSSWQQEVVDATAQVGGELRVFLALDPDGNPHILYADSNSASLRLASKLEDAWTITTVLSEPVESCGVQFDSLGRRHVCYGVLADRICHAIEHDSGWSVAYYQVGVPFFETAMVLDSQDDAHVAAAITGAWLYVHFPWNSL